MKDTAAHIEMLYNKAKDYTETSVELYKLQALDSTAQVVSSLASKALLILVAATFLLFLNIGLSLYVGHLLKANYLGFFLVSGGYLIIGLLIFLFRKPLVEFPVSDIIIKSLKSKTKNIEPLKVVKDENALQ